MQETLLREPTDQATDWVALMHQVGPGFAARVAEADDDKFVAANYAELKQHRVFAAAVPAELGGGGASHRELCDMLRVLAQYCSSTALALAMHTHVVATAAWRWRHDKAPMEAMLKRVAAEQIVLVSTGGGDWLKSIGKAEKVEGGFKIHGRKAFASGVPLGNVLNTSAVYDDPAAGPTVLHFGVPLNAAGVRIEETWAALGMRGTGSHDVVLDGVFVADAGVAGKRPQGKWHRLFHTISMVAFPLIYSAYVGVAEAARERALALALARRDDTDVQLLAGEMENELAAARFALADMIANAAESQPGPETTNRVFIARTLAGNAAIRAVEKAMAVAGGAAMYRGRGLERLFRDVQGARYHPVQEKPQQRMAGRLALGLDIDG